MGRRAASWAVLFGMILCASMAEAAPQTFTISGVVETDAGVGVEGVSVAGDNGASSVVTGADGSYSVTVSNNWGGTVTVSKSGWLITPASKVYSKVRENISGDNYIGYQPKISGYVKKADGTALVGATVSASGGASATTNTSGYYEITAAYGWSGTVSAILTGYSFTAKSYSNVTADQANQDFAGYQPKISGYVKKADGTALGGTTVAASSGESSITDASGYYEITVAYGWSGTVSTSLAGYRFTAKSYSNVTTDQANQDFAGYQPKISGYVKKADGTALAGATVSASGGASAVTNANGYYEITVAYGWSGTVTASLSGYKFTAKSYSNITGDWINQNYTAFQPVISGYTIGKVGVTVTASGVGSVTSNSSCYYSITVPYGWSGTVAANLAGYNFIGSPRTYTNVMASLSNQSFTASQPYFYGYVKNYTGMILSGVTITASGVGSTTTGSSGYYSLTVPYGWSGTLTASKIGCSFGEPVTVTNKTANWQQDFTEKRFKICGYVKDRNGTGVSSVYLNGMEVYTSSIGYYEAIVSYGWPGTITPSKTGYSFEPANKVITNLTGDVNDVNFVALQFTLAGMIVDRNGAAVSGVSVRNGSSTTTTDASGKYSFKVPGKWTGTLTASKTGYVFNPANRSYSQLMNDVNDANFIAVQPRISGFVRDNHDSVLAGATISTGTSVSSTTDANGFYMLDIPYNFSGTVTPSKAGYNMSPTSRSYSYLKADANEQDYTAIEPWVSGTIRDANGAGAGGVTVAAGTTATTTTDPNGRYVLKLNYNWSGTVTPVMGGYAFSPASRSYTSMQADSNEQDYVIGRTINLSKTSCAFTAYGKSGSSAGQTFLITTSGGTMDWRIELPTGCGWLNVSPLSGQVSDGNSVVTITVDPNKANYGSNSCQLKVVSDTAVNSPQTVSVSLYVYGPSISMTPSQSMSIRALKDEKLDKTFEVKNSGYDVLHWTIQPDANCGWIKSVLPLSGECAAGQSQIVTLQIDANGLADGSYTGQLRIVSPEVSSRYLYVYLTVHTPKVLYVPRDYPTIAAAHNAAYTYGDTIVVEPGRHMGGCSSIYKSLVIRSTAPEDPNVVAATIVTSGITEYNRDTTGYIKIQGLTFVPALAYVQGAAIVSDHSQNVEISNCVIKNWGQGGIGIQYANPRTVLIKNCVITGNCIAGIRTPSRTDNVSIDIVNCTIADTLGNGSEPAAGIRMDGYSNNRITITNSILSNRLTPGDKEVWFTSISSHAMNYLSISNSCVPAWPNSIMVQDSNYLTVNYGPGNIESDPCFARAGRFDDNGTPADANDDMWIGGDYHLKSTAGRWEMNELIDMDGGADGVVNMLDLAVLAGEWGKTTKRISSNGYPYLRADLDNNGRVDINDLAILCQDYLYEYENGWWIYDDVSSPCIDGGDVNSDWGSEPLPNGGRINMGAYGGTGQASMSE